MLLYVLLRRRQQIWDRRNFSLFHHLNKMILAMTIVMVIMMIDGVAYGFYRKSCPYPPFNVGTRCPRKCVGVVGDSVDDRYRRDCNILPSFVNNAATKVGALSRLKSKRGSHEIKNNTDEKKANMLDSTIDDGEGVDGGGVEFLLRDRDQPPQRPQKEKSINRQQQRNNDPEWKFFDTARIHVSGGMGGNGCVAFRREKGEALGGPAGGRGGTGGSVYFICDNSLNTLAPLRQRVHIRATKGQNGTGKNRDGSRGNDVFISVPPGTVVRELHTQKLAGELRNQGERLLVARGGRGGRGNAAFMTSRRTAPRLAERGEPGSARWLSVELRLVADVGFLGMPNAGKSTLLAAASAARPKIADYPFTTIVPNLGVCDLGSGSGLVLCDIPGLIEGAASGAGLGQAFLRHVQRCRVLLHVIDGSSADPIGDFVTINRELQKYDSFLAQKPQVVVVNKIDISEVREHAEATIKELKEVAGHTRVLSISAATTERVKELMGRLKKFVNVQPEPDLPPPVEVDFSTTGLDFDSDDFEIITDPAYPGQFRIKGPYIEQVAKMTHWEYPEAVERFGRQLEALGISSELVRRGAIDGDLVMVDEYDFDFAPGMTNPYIPPDLLERDAQRDLERLEEEEGGGGIVGTTSCTFSEDTTDLQEDESSSPQRKNWDAYYVEDEDVEELMGFDDLDDWDMLDKVDDGDNDFTQNQEFDVRKTLD